MTTLTRLQTILVNNYPLQREVLTPDALLADLEIDSLGVMELLFNIEEEFKLSVPNSKQDLRTICDVVDYIDRLTVEQHGHRAAGAAATGAVQ